MFKEFLLRYVIFGGKLSCIIHLDFLSKRRKKHESNSQRTNKRTILA
jgi:hypothetical protein